MKKSHKIVAVLAIGLLGASYGCSSGDDSRTVTKEESAAADVKRQSYVDGLKIPESQKAAMKAHMGGPPVADPAAKAKANANNPTDRRN